MTYTLFPHRLAAVAASAVISMAASADEMTPDDYMDDRSTGVSVVQSYYNAINRKEYVRAYSYFGENAGQPDFGTFEQGFADTDHVRVKLGAVTEEGAAGSIFTNVPVAIESMATDGTTKVFSGCTVTRLAQPTIQGVPFNPRHISKAELAESAQSFDDVEPSCPM